MNMRWYRLDFGADLRAEAVLHYVRTFSARQRHGWLGEAEPLVLEVASEGGHLRWFLGVSSRERDQLLGNLRLALPEVRTTLEERTLPTLTLVWELRTQSPRRPLRTDIAAESSAATLAALRLARRGETVILHWLVGPWLRRSVPVAANHQKHDTVLDIGKLTLTSEQVRALRKKYDEPLFGVVGRIAVAAASQSRARQLGQHVVGALQLVRSPGTGIERRLIPAVFTPSRFRQLQHPVVGWPCVLSASELTAVLGWPIGNPVIEGVSYRGHRQLPAAPGAITSFPDNRITGEATFPGRDGYLHQTIAAALHHTWIVGPTGVGKSTVLGRLALADISAGRGVVVVDASAKGDLVRDIADRIPQHRADDVVWLDPADDHPVGLNVLAGDPDAAADAITHVMHELYAAHWGPRTADVLHHSVLTLARRGGLTLCELPPLLLNANFRRQVIAGVRGDHLGVGPFWSWFEALSEAERPVVVGPVLNKLRQFTQRPAIRAVIGQTTCFDPKRVFSNRKVFLVNLATGQVGAEASQLLGALVVGQLWRAIQARAAVPPDRRRPIVIYLDEFQNVLRLPLDIGDAMVTSRGLGVGLVLANQHLGQLSTAIRAAVLANARSKIAFQLNHDDAVAMSKQLDSGLTPLELQNLGRFESYQAIYTGAGATMPASAVTLPLPPSLGSLDAVRTASRKRYGRPRAEVDAELLARRSVQRSNDGPIGSRKRGGRS